MGHTVPHNPPLPPAHPDLSWAVLACHDPSLREPWLCHLSKQAHSLQEKLSSLKYHLPPRKRGVCEMPGQRCEWFRRGLCYFCLLTEWRRKSHFIKLPTSGPLHRVPVSLGTWHLAALRWKGNMFSAPFFSVIIKPPLPTLIFLLRHSVMNKPCHWPIQGGHGVLPSKGHGMRDDIQVLCLAACLPQAPSALP